MAPVTVLASAFLLVFSLLLSEARTLLERKKSARTGSTEGLFGVKKAKYADTSPVFIPPSDNPQMNEFMAVDTSGEFIRHLCIEEGRAICAGATSRNKRPTEGSPHSEDMLVVEGMLRGRPQTRFHALFDGYQGSDVAKWLAEHLATYLNDIRDVNADEISTQFARMDRDLRAADVSGGSSGQSSGVGPWYGGFSVPLRVRRFNFPDNCEFARQVLRLMRSSVPACSTWEGSGSGSTLELIPIRIRDISPFSCLLYCLCSPEALLLFIEYQKNPGVVEAAGRQIIPQGALEFITVAEAEGGPLLSSVKVNFKRDPEAQRGIYLIHVVSLGHGRAFIKSGKRIYPMTYPHTAESKFERARVQSAGGTFSLVNGEMVLGDGIPVTRAFGSYEFKKEEGGGARQSDVISAVPDVNVFFAYPGDSIIAGTQGAFAHTRTRGTLRSQLESYKITRETVVDVAKAMVVHAKVRKVAMNISTFVGYLPDYKLKTRMMKEGTSDQKGDEYFSIDRTTELSAALRKGTFSFLLHCP